MAEHHGHHHHHGGHSHAPADFGRAFAIGITLNILFATAEAAAGLAFGSMALLADAGHNFSDVLGLAVAWVGAGLSKRPPTRRFTWGYRGSSILASLANSLLLLVALGAIVLEAASRFTDPPPAPGQAMVLVAAIGVVVNLATALLFVSGRKRDLNIRGAYLHMAADAGVSAGVVVAGLLILWTGASWIDPAVTLVIAAIIFWNTWGLLKQSVFMSLGAVPEGIEPEEVERALAGLPGVTAVHDLHIWPMGTTDTVMTAHLVMADGHPGNGFLASAQKLMHDRFGIGHATLQIELELGADCQDCGTEEAVKQ
ncbi:cation diffusion facilitator family transporter [Sphingosinicella sp. CPCC 101087]|uniref:cation diffusion facilitator family transporter n=1 Tax=Sphingosinicella sp. CPCC 101087 TaxID=2497754 RepID=UPI001FB0F785|nr:cation diffusion facilitator family transporter [Sphingosinicella sp. CPCC 101087]